MNWKEKGESLEREERRERNRCWAASRDMYCPEISEQAMGRMGSPVIQRARTPLGIEAIPRTSGVSKRPGTP